MVSNEQSIADYLRQFLSGQGFSGQNLNAAEADILGNLQQESGFNPGATAANDGGPGVNAHGIAQWEGSRYSGPNGLLAFAQGTGGNATTLTTQEQFLGYELTHGYSNVLAQLRGVTDVNAGAQIVQSKYEGSTVASLGARQSNADTIYQQITQGAPLTLGGPVGQQATLASAQSDILPGGGWNPINWPGDILSSGASAAGDAITSAVNSLLGPIEKTFVHWAQDVLALIVGIVLVVVAIKLVAESSGDSSSSSSPPPAKGGDEEKPAAGGGAEAEAAEVAA